MERTSAESVPSPCRDVCRLNAANICVGCGRSIDEIAEWSRAGYERRVQICREARARYLKNSEAAEAGEIPDRNPR